MTWYIIILIVLLFIWKLQLTAYSNIHYSDKRLILFCILLLGFFMAFRAETIGTDTKHYTYAYRIISEASWNDFLRIKIFAWASLDGDLEYGYRILNKLLSLISTDSQTIIIGVTVIILALLFRSSLQYSHGSLLSVWLFFTLGLYQTSFNVSRNALAILIAFDGFRYIREKKPIQYAIMIVIASFFHQSCIFLFPLYWLANYVRLNYKQINICVLCLPLLLLVIDMIVNILSLFLPIRYQGYFLNAYTKPEGILVSLVFVLLFYFIRFFTYKKDMENAIVENSIGTWMFIITIVLSVFGYYYGIFYRASSVFGYYMIIYFSNLLMETKSRRINERSRLVLFVTMTAIIYIGRIQINNIGSTMPYMFFWE